MADDVEKNNCECQYSAAVKQWGRRLRLGHVPRDAAPLYRLSPACTLRARVREQCRSPRALAHVLLNKRCVQALVV